MGDLTENLSAHEFACQCKRPDCEAHKSVAHYPLVVAIQGASDHFKDKHKANAVRVEITGGNRCRAHNETIAGSAKNSKHISCIAADHRISVRVGTLWLVIPQKELYDYYDHKYFDRYGVSLYVGRVHLDTRAQRWRDPKEKP